MLLDNKIAIVTGGGQGIGKGIAKAMAQSGAKVIIAELNKNLANVVDEIPNSKFIVCDVGDEVSVQSLINNVLSEFERIDILVNNAGIIVRKDAIDHTLNDWNNVLRVNLTGPFLMSKYTLKDAMIKQHSGCIINIGSTAGMNGYNRISYSSTKAAIVNLSKSLALEVGQYGIRVNCICPGLIRTDLNSNLMDQPEMLVKLLPKVPMGRIGTPEDVAKVAVFLASNEADYVNGVALLVDGGQLCGFRVFD